MGRDEFKLTSAGIDIGTTTTQVIISEITMRNRLPGARIPLIEITDKKILYNSPIYITPIIDHKAVNAVSLKEIIRKEYRSGGFNSNEIDTGAVIITGETAKKENAEWIVHELAEFAGDFVVAVAGPDLESVLAGKGSGAADFSKENHRRIINLDIGGGTTNIAVFEKGHVMDVTCVNVGGRLIEVEKETGTVTFVSKPARVFLDSFGIEVVEGRVISLENLERFCDAMVELTEDVIYGREIVAGLREILMSQPLKGPYEYDGLIFSGGVAEYIYDNELSDGNAFQYGDVGFHLAKAFLKSRMIRKQPLESAKNKIRATVIGAGTQTVSISGSTVFVQPELLPMRNIPVAKLPWEVTPDDEGLVIESIRDIARRYRHDLERSALALYIPKPESTSFLAIRNLAMAIYSGWKDVEATLVVISEKDIAKILGQSLHVLSEGKLKFISIDSVNVKDGDYIDIGRPITDDGVVPVIIKTLVF